MNSSDKFYIKEFRNGKKIVVFFGSVHSKSPDQISSIKKTISKLNPEIILMEGSYHLADFKSEKEAIGIGNEMGYASFLAKDHRIRLESNDPSFSQDILFVTERYGREISFAYFFLRNKSHNWPEDSILKNLKENSSWEDFEYLSESFKKIFNKTLNEKYDPLKNYSDYFNPTLNKNIFNKITLELSKFRDNFMLEKIKEYLKKYDRIFILKGVYHLDENEEKIKGLLENVK